MRRLILFVLLAVLSWISLPVQAEERMPAEKSLEWLCFEAELVVTGTLTAVNDLAGPGKNRSLRNVTVRVGEVIKGPSSLENCFVSTRHLEIPTLERYRKEGIRLLFFLRRTIQSYSYESRTYDLWPLFLEDGSVAAFDLSRPDGRLVGARSFEVLQSEKRIRALCRQTIAHLDALRKRHPQERVQKMLLEVPADREDLRGRKISYLLVPARLLPPAGNEER